MRASLFAVISLVIACSPADLSEAHGGTTGAQVAPRLTSPAPRATAQVSQPNDQADFNCQIVLRYTDVNFESRLGPQSDCSSGTCWTVIPIYVDVAMGQVLAGSEVEVLYSGADAQWHQVTAIPTTGAPIGYRRYEAILNSETFTTGPASDVVSFIPFLWIPTAGERLFDHNQVSDVLASYQLTPDNNWTLNENLSVCPGASPAGVETLTFSQSWQNGASGSLLPSGKLDVNYDIYRIPQGLGCTTDGVNAVAVTGYAQFQPSGAVLSEEIDGPFNGDAGVYSSLPLEFDVPGNASSVALWFLDSSECRGDNWDSDFGQNYVYQVQ